MIEIDILEHQLEKINQVDEDLRSMRQQDCVAPENDWLDEKFIVALNSLGTSYEAVEEILESYKKTS